MLTRPGALAIGIRQRVQGAIGGRIGMTVDDQDAFGGPQRC